MQNYPSTSIVSKNELDSIWNHPNNLDLLGMKRSSLTPTMKNSNSFLQISPSIRRLYTIFDSIYPNFYRIHCSDSFQTLNELLCLINEYLHIPSISANELLSNEKYFDDFISELRRPSILRQKTLPTIKPELHCFGQGIHPYDYNNQLNQTTYFCFELTTKNSSSSIDVLIYDPNENLVRTNITHVNTYNQGHTKLYSCSYTPLTKSGIYKILFYYNNVKLIDQQYSVFIHKAENEEEEEEELINKSK